VIKQNPGVLFGYKEEGEWIEIKSLHNHSRKFFKAIVIDMQGKEISRRVPKGTFFGVFLGVE
jgi:hypothetical protein